MQYVAGCNLKRYCKFKFHPKMKIIPPPPFILRKIFFLLEDTICLNNESQQSPKMFDYQLFST